MKKIALIIVFFLQCLVPSSVVADSAQIQAGLIWLINAKNGNDYWGCKFFIDKTVDEVTDEDITPTYFRDTCEATNTLSALNQTGTDYNAAINWISDNKPITTEKISRKIESLSTTSLPYADDLNLLLSYQNADGGFGGYRKLRSNVADSTYALRALQSIIYSNHSIIEKIIQYIKNSQNEDGGWGFKNDQESKIYYTALVLQTLSQFKTTYDLNTPLANAAAYLLTKQNPDGGFGSSPSTVFETAVSYLAVINSGQVSNQPLQDAIAYLTATQQANGSWNDDPYSTALALRALANVKPNLTITSTDITFSNPTPTIGDTISITANVHNTGPTQADAVFVRFYDGDPSSGATLIGEATISIPVFGSSPASITYTIPTASSKTIFVTIDPLNTIDELNEADNTASKNLTSATLPDLSITSADITLAPSSPKPSTDFSISAMIRNKGESFANNVTVDFYDSDPAAGGTRIGDDIILSGFLFRSNA